MRRSVQTWGKFARRWIVVLVALVATFAAVFYAALWRLAEVKAWAVREWTFPGGPDLAVFVDGWTATGVAAALTGLVFTAGTWWAAQAKPSDRVDPRKPTGTVFGAIPQPATWFQPRPAEQRALERALAGNKKAALVALPGARGAGKTQLAAAYARRCVQIGFDFVAWINAQSGPVSELAALGAQLGLAQAEQSAEQLAARVIQIISANDGKRRLVVFDNAVEPDDLKPFLPTAGTAKVIVTSNRQEFKTMPAVAPVEVGMFTPAQGVALLTKATSDPDRASAFELGQQMGWLPLGLAQAAAYMVLNKLSCQMYLRQLSTVALDEILVQQAGADHPGVLKATQLSIEAINRIDPHGHASRLLAMLAVLAPEGISRALLTRPHVLDALNLDDTNMNRALRVLSNASLITLAQQDQLDAVVVAVHRLTATVIRHHAVQQESLVPTIASATTLTAALTDNFPFSQVARRRHELGELVTHILALHQNSPRPTAPLLVARNWAGQALEAAGDLGQAIILFEQTLADRERILGPDHADTLTSRNNLALAYESAGRLDQAIALHEQNLADRKRILGPDHPNTLNSRNNLAMAYKSAGRLDQAIALHEQNLADCERILGPDHPNTLNSRNNLAGAYQSSGRLDQAIGLYEQNLADCERILGPDHPNTLTSRNNLAAARREAGRDHKST